MVGTISDSLRGCLSGLDVSLYLIETGFYRNRSAQIEEGLDVTKRMADRIQKLVLDILYYPKERDLEISDNGPGMEKEEVSKIFQLFSSSKDNRGTSIGLFVTRKAILKNRGTISVDSSPHKGARFRIPLPRKPKPNR